MLVMKDKPLITNVIVPTSMKLHLIAQILFERMNRTKTGDLFLIFLECMQMNVWINFWNKVYNFFMVL